MELDNAGEKRLKLLDTSFNMSGHSDDELQSMLLVNDEDNESPIEVETYIQFPIQQVSELNMNDKQIETKEGIETLVQHLELSISALEGHTTATTTTNKKRIQALQLSAKQIHSQYVSVKSFYLKRLAGLKKMEASQEVAKEVFGKEAHHSYKAKAIRVWAEQYAIDLCFQPTRKGKHSKKKTIILDETIKIILKERLRSMNEEERTPSKFMKLLNESWLSGLPQAPPQVSKETARRWMSILGFVTCEGTKRHYVEATL